MLRGSRFVQSSECLYTVVGTQHQEMHEAVNWKGQYACLGQHIA